MVGPPDLLRRFLWTDERTGSAKGDEEGRRCTYSSLILVAVSAAKSNQKSLCVCSLLSAPFDSKEWSRKFGGFYSKNFFLYLQDLKS